MYKYILFLQLIRWFTYTWTFGEVLCKLVYYLQEWSAVCSVSTLSFLAMQRCHAAVQPFRVREQWTGKLVRLSLLSICLSSAILTAPLLFGQKHKSVGYEPDRHFWCVTEFGDDSQLTAFEAYMFVLVVLLPLLAMTSWHTFVLCTIRRRQRLFTGSHFLSFAAIFSHFSLSIRIN